jgi:hypothetical protein
MSEIPKRKLKTFLFTLASLGILGAHGVRPAHGETWSDTTGNFKVEAKYAGISGTNVVLQKPDGKTINVPINKLSPESRAQAKRFYEMAKVGLAPTDPAATVGSAVAATSKYQPKPRPLNFTPPTPPAIPPMTAFPENASLQATWEHVRDQALAGHLEVLWHAMPDDIRALADGSEVREKLGPHMKDNLNVSPEMIEATNKLTEILVTKKPFILKSPLLAQVPPQFIPMINQAYDPAVGVVHEFAEFSFNANTDAILAHSTTDILDYHLSRLGAHLQALLKIVPTEIREGLIAGITTSQTDETTGTMTIPKQDGSTEAIEMVRYNNRWLPKDMVTQWEVEKDTMIDKMVENASSRNLQIGNNAESQAMFTAAIQQANGMMDPLLAAMTQTEFDLALGQVLMPVMMMMGGAGGPGGPDAGGPGLGFPQ